ncbi:MAG: sterol desaturase family protein [Polyangiales bacterium]
MKLLGLILASYASAGIAMVGLYYVYKTHRMQHWMISDDPHRAKPDAEIYRSALLNMVVSVALIFSAMYGLQNFLYYDHAIPWWRYVLEIVTVIMIYDFAYYFVHRYLFHEWRTLRWVHSIHHASRNPRVVDSLLLHPIETIIGLSLFFGSVMLVGGVHFYTLGVLFTAYTAFNVLNHAGVNVDRFPFKTMGVLAVKHDRHHHSMLSGNYASITPLPDIIFGTVE